jgi:hypothetical protein
MKTEEEQKMSDTPETDAVCWERQFDELLIEVTKTVRATVIVKVPKGVVFSRGYWWVATERGIRRLEFDANFWGQIDNASFEATEKEPIKPVDLLGCIHAGDLEPTFYGSKARTWPTNAVQLDAIHYLSDRMEGEE